MSAHDKMHELLNKGLEQAPDPISGAAFGAAGGATIGAITTGVALHAAGVTVGGLLATAQAVGVVATVGALGSIAAPVVVTCAGAAAIYGALHGLKNWAQKRG
jgi:hypothetical protein